MREIEERVRKEQEQFCEVNINGQQGKRKQ